MDLTLLLLVAPFHCNIILSVKVLFLYLCNQKKSREIFVNQIPLMITILSISLWGASVNVDGQISHMEKKVTADCFA